MSSSVQILGVAAGGGAGTIGAERGPDALRTRGLVARLEQLGLNVNDLGDVPGFYEASDAPSGADYLVRNLPNIVQVNRHTHAAVLNARRQQPDSFLLIVGGDHSLAIGTLGGLSDSCRRLGLIWVDAHPDLNTPETSPSGNIHGMSLAVARDMGLRSLREIATSYPMIEDEDIWMLAIRDIDPGEQEEIDSSAMHAFTADELRSAGVVETVTKACRSLAEVCDHVHLSFDIDSLDADLVPGTGTPVPGGLTFDEASALLATLRSFGLPHSAEFVEYNPQLDPSGETGERTLRLIETLLRQGG
jgi:arginase